MNDIYDEEAFEAESILDTPDHQEEFAESSLYHPTYVAYTDHADSLNHDPI